ncbi:uncharacterized protein HD556DRAFT_1306749 [Suillus plorans]|uniref:Uncharacterized protein n=1 Tax=Suillus plorans TaxID=116603 RepID=A0A9P7IXD2_9AGAM|nr:uncharacterized protein HD556DRAFT_1306749 [Suillus plorans]KAG1797053.1 hypothetical protein HD556DRAFT_1306749 [Suillus plorans]
MANQHSALHETQHLELLNQAVLWFHWILEVCMGHGMQINRIALNCEWVGVEPLPEVWDEDEVAENEPGEASREGNESYQPFSLSSLSPISENEHKPSKVGSRLHSRARGIALQGGRTGGVGQMVGEAREVPLAPPSWRLKAIQQRSPVIEPNHSDLVPEITTIKDNTIKDDTINDEDAVSNATTEDKGEIDELFSSQLQEQT